MAAPIITPIPTPPIRSDAPADFATKADAFAASLPQFVTEANTSAEFVDQRAIEADASATAAADSALAAAGSGAAAADQVALAIQEADRSESAASSAEVSAAAAGAAAGLPSLAGNAGKALVVLPDESGVEFATVGSELKRSARTANLMLAAADKGWLVDITSGAFTQAFAPAAELGDGWYCYLRNSGAGDITLDPNSAGLIDGLASYVMYPGEVRLVQCDGVALRTIVLNTFSKTFAVSGMFTKPPGYTFFEGVMWAGGRGGSPGGTLSGDGAGGAGSDQVRFLVPKDSISASESVVIGAGGGPSAFGGDTSLGAVVSTQSAATRQGISAPGGAGAASRVGSGIGNNGMPSNSGGGGGGSGGVSAGAGFSNLVGGSGGISTLAGKGGAGGTSGTYNGNSTTGPGGPGFDGVAPGGGGGGGGSRGFNTSFADGAGGNGARGELRIWGII